tara:strand:+ start:1605 stop:1808 length:204 start_codon:yes stop_codon:yes gene_type:complete
MSNYTDKHDKLATHLQELYKRHRSLDQEIKVLYNQFVENHELNLLKTKKLWLKDEIYRIENELKALG